MHEFKYKNNHLYCETIKVEDITRRIPTPFYLYSYKTLIDHYRKLEKAFSSVKPLICYSMKANSNLSICRALVKAGAGLDIVSGGELFKALKVGVNPAKIVYASVGKTEAEIEQAVKAKILLFNVESEPELQLINDVSRRLNRETRVSLRLNPGVKADTHHYITTGAMFNKFGLDFSAAKNILFARSKYSNLQIIGLHLHIGSQITEAKPYLKAISKTINFIKKINHRSVNIEYLNIGGGLGIVYKEERPQTAQEFARAILPLLKPLRQKIILEPGRFIVGNSGILVAKVLYVKEAPVKKFVIVDAGMNDLIRPSLYNAYHEILPLAKSQNKKSKVKNQKFDVVGPICESGDFLAKDRIMPLLKSGDMLAVMGAGAYGFSMSSNYNSRPKLAEVMVIKNKFYITRKRETYSDLIKGETVPKILK